MNKVCIVTNYRGTANYGAILQAYALNAFIRSKGWECQTLNYCALRINRRKLIRSYINHPSVIAALLREKILRKMAIHVYRKRSSVFDRFRDECIPHTKECSDQNAYEIVKEFDILVCGSDQIWRPSLQTGEFNDVMWLKPFSDNIPKLSYAASLGITELDDGKIAYIRDALKDFRTVSVREESAQKLLEQVCGRKIQTALDPVFLLKSEEWKAFADYKNRTQKYIFVYFIEPKRKIYKQIEAFARARNKEIVYMPYMGYKFNYPDFRLHGRKVLAATPQEFVGYIDAAEYVFTDSFHTTAFSIMLHKNFYVYITNHGTRLKNLLNLVEMKERIVEDPALLDRNIADVIWEEVDQRLDMKRKDSSSFLLQMLSQ